MFSAAELATIISTAFVAVLSYFIPFLKEHSALITIAGIIVIVFILWVKKLRKENKSLKMQLADNEKNKKFIAVQAKSYSAENDKLKLELISLQQKAYYIRALYLSLGEVISASLQSLSSEERAHIENIYAIYLKRLDELNSYDFKQ